MNFGIGRSEYGFLWLFLFALLAFVCFGCSDADKEVVPKSGTWTAGFTDKTGDGQIRHWSVSFIVNKDKSVSSVHLSRYTGEMDEKVHNTEMYSLTDPFISDNSFEIIFSDFYNDIPHTYRGTITFISKKEAEGSIVIDGVENRWKTEQVTK